MADGRTSLIRSILARVKEEVDKVRYEHQLGRVVQLEPLTVELMSSGTALVEDDGFILGGMARQIESEIGLKLNEHLVMHRVSGNWVGVDVLHDKSPGGNEEGTKFANRSETKGFKEHGEDENADRPSYPSVEWNGTVEPANAIDNDTWVRPPTP